jgi:copper chaperone CopZ|mmetsp:Transcript_3765/g.4999  ORF Transcript_3765/g.4999 Transcript_3765/m.4999 type:complete len:197 (+) Transcript_3765:82-672(+)|eukprot:CAMPEP_0195256886 /NCGR_PEP_ID=MMETSP0706-20130129/6491_1 /TAXON_ID=33640 /ORGANISM="Asterionellopsis glacialis, Strain CCMP134" /LENGTH=196 /DNA_ID=CAMNT_0040309991 /DNA_START=82 /DNA_END=672 /DNA_ORIENTATION=-
MSSHYLKINTAMVCGGCTGTVEKALLAVPGVHSVSVALSSQSVKVDTMDDSVACQCTKTAEGKCPCGSNCQCMGKSLVAALKDVGFDAEISGDASTHKCDASGTKKGPCGAPDCTCGGDCQCGTDCKCGGCPGSKSCGQGSESCGRPNCTCGPSCTCGDACSCPTCPEPGRSIDMTSVAIGIACIGIGWMAAKRFK